MYSHRASGSVTYLEDFELEYTMEELIAKIEAADISARCLSINHNTANDKSHRILSNICTSEWSVGSNPSCIPVLSSLTPVTERVVLPVYKAPCSRYVQTLLKGGPLSALYPATPRLLGDTSFYTRYIRGAKTRSGRCWDCQSLYALALKLNSELRIRQPRDYVDGLKGTCQSFDTELQYDVSI